MLQEEPPVTGASPPRPVLPGKSTPIIPTIKNPEHPFIMSGQQERQRSQRRAEEEGLGPLPTASAALGEERGGRSSVRGDKAV